MGAMATRLRGLETIVYSRDPDEKVARRVAAIGARYVPKLNEKGEVVNHLAHLPESLGAFDFILEATGSAQVALGAMRIIGINGILCLTSVTGGESVMEICPDCLNFEMVLGNRTVFGSVNAHRVDFEQGVRDLEACHERWPGWLDGLITRRVPLASFREGLDRKPGDVKVVVEFSPAA
jgi:threonine dehydrogenase-like Zn-dependent dehydrogenase